MSGEKAIARLPGMVQGVVVQITMKASLSLRKLSLAATARLALNSGDPSLQPTAPPAD